MSMEPTSMDSPLCKCAPRSRFCFFFPLSLLFLLGDWMLIARVGEGVERSVVRWRAKSRNVDIGTAIFFSFVPSSNIIQPYFLEGTLGCHPDLKRTKEQKEFKRKKHREGREKTTVTCGTSLSPSQRIQDERIFNRRTKTLPNLTATQTKTHGTRCKMDRRHERKQHGPYAKTTAGRRIVFD